MMRSTRRALAGCAAGHSCRLRDAGTARASADTQDSAAGVVLPAAQSAQAPEQAALARPARLPKVPAGQSEHAAAPAGAKVPGAQGTQLPPAPGAEPAAHAGASAAVLPAVQPTQAPEQAALERPAWSPKVPAGQSEQAAAPTSE